MKTRIIAVVTVTVLVVTLALAGCSAQQNAPAATQAPAATEAAAVTEAPAATAAPAQQDNGTIDLDKAKSIATEDAGVNAADVTFTKANLDTDDGVQKYEIEFTYNGNEYEYDINAKTGEIMEKSKEVVEPYDD